MCGEHVTDGLRNETVVAIEAAAEALLMARQPLRRGDIWVKAGRDLVTTVDVAVEDAIRERLTEALGLACIGEERGGSVPRPGAAYWLVDPICGTTNFAAGIPLYGVNLALVEDGTVTAAVVGDGLSGKIFVAEQGAGAFAFSEGTRSVVRVGDHSRTIVFEDSKSTGSRRARAASFAGRLVEADRWNFRSFGTSLPLAFLAAGQVSAYVDFVLTDVHGAAGVTLAREAGATITDLDGVASTLASDSIIAASTPREHETLLALAAVASPEAELKAVQPDRGGDD
jgi:myo-inositol-1(or 4)-monophosphatase